MSSTVTTATVSTVTAAITVEGLGQALMMVALVLLGLAVLAKEISTVSQSPLGRAFSRGLDISVTPLVSVFALLIVLNAVSYFQGF